MNSFMQYAIHEAKKAYEKNLVPIGCVIVQNNQIIAKAHNQKFWHAEIICIDKAQKKVGYLQNSTIYTTVEPCPMCLYAIKLAKLKTIVFGCKNEKIINHKLEIIDNIKNEECMELMKNFFYMKREIK